MPSGQPRAIGDVLAQLMARRGYAALQSSENCALAWSQAAGEALAKYSRATGIKRGKLEVTVDNSLLVQEIGFRKPELIKRLGELLPDENIRDLKLRVGPIA